MAPSGMYFHEIDMGIQAAAVLCKRPGPLRRVGARISICDEAICSLMCTLRVPDLAVTFCGDRMDKRGDGISP